MLPIQIITTTPGSNGFTLEGKGDTRIKLIATNLNTALSHNSHYDFRSCLNFLSDETTSGIIIVITKTKPLKGLPECDTIMLRVSGGQVQLHEFWQSQLPGRDISVSNSSDAIHTSAIVRVRGESGGYYATARGVSAKYYVPDANLLCKYVVGDADEGILQAVATWQAAEISAQERLPELEATVARLERENEGLRHSINRKQQLIEGVSKHLLKLLEMCSRNWWWRKAIRKEINETLDLIAE